MIKDLSGLVEYLKKEIQSRTDVAVVGLSGGIDSSTIATLCTLTLGPENVYGYSMPYGETDKNTFNTRSTKLAAHLGINHEFIWIDLIANAIIGAADVGSSGLQKGNARSRARMCVLYAKAGYLNETLGKRVRVIGTGNLSEDFIGYDTKGGDALCDFFPIGELFKSEVYQLAEHLGLPEELIDRVPSAGLWPGQTDEGELGHSYDSMEPVIKAIKATCDSVADMLELQSITTDPLTKFVLDRHFANKHKHEAPPAISARIRGFTD